MSLRGRARAGTLILVAILSIFVGKAPERATILGLQCFGMGFRVLEGSGTSSLVIDCLGFGV